MPTVNLTDRQLEVLAAACRISLDADEAFELLSAATESTTGYEGMSGSLRNEVHELSLTLDAVAKEHAEAH